MDRLQAAGHVRVMLADDDPRMRAGIRTIVESDPRLRVVAEAGDGRVAIELAQRHRPDVALLDIRMPTLDGLVAAEQIIRTVSETAVVMVTTFGENAYVDRAIDLGVAGFLLKSGDPHDLIFGILAAAHGGSCLSPVVARRVMADLRAERRISRTPETLALSGLTPRQRDILRLLAQGRTNAEIAGDLHLTEGTVKGYLREVFARLAVRNRVEAALLAHEIGIDATS